MRSAPHCRSRTLPVLNIVVSASIALAACTSSQEPPDEPEFDSPGTASTQLIAALETIPDIRQDLEYAEVKFGDTKALRSLLGDDWYSADSAFSGLQGYGSFPLNTSGELREELTAIDARKGEFIASIYNPTNSRFMSWTTVAGGQDADAVRDAFLELGWEETDSGLEATEETMGPDADRQSQGLSAEFLEVELKESTVEFGTLGSASHSASGVLADDPRLVDLAACLGEVMAVVFVSGDIPGGNPPQALAVGVRTAASADETPQIVACSSWQDSKQAEAFATKATKTLESGRDPVGNYFSEVYPHPTVEHLEGEFPLVQITTDTTEKPHMVMDGFHEAFEIF